MSATQKAVLVQQFEPDSKVVHTAVTVDQIPIPEPGEGEVLVKVLLRPINPVDIMALQGYLPFFKPKFPAVPGSEGVAQLASDGRRYKKGQRVVARGWGVGCWQTYRTIAEEKLEAVPDSVSNEQAASFWINPMTALGILEILDAPKGEWIIQTAAGSAVGRFIIQIAKARGALRELDARSSEFLKIDADQDYQCDEENLEKRVGEATGGKAIYGGADAVAGEMTGTLISCVRNEGQVLIYGFLAGQTLSASATQMLFGARRIQGFGCSAWFQKQDKEYQDYLVKELFDLMSNGQLQGFIGQTFPMDDVQEAIIESAHSSQKGKMYISN